MLDVERQRSNTPQAELPRRGAENLQLTQMLHRSEDEVAELQARSKKVWCYLEPTQHMQDEEHSSELEWVHMEENQPESAATGGGWSTDDTTLIEGVEPSSCAAPGDRLSVHQQFLCAACPGDLQATPESTNAPVGEPERVERDTTAQKKRKPNHLS